MPKAHFRLPSQLAPQLAPQSLAQSILPWSWFQGASFSLFSFVSGETPAPDLEEQILDEVGSYGRQLGRIGDAMEVLISLVPREGLDADQRRALIMCQAQLSQIRSLKQRAGRP